VSDDVNVSWAAMMRKLMWSTICSVDNGEPSSQVTWQSREKRSYPPRAQGKILDDERAAPGAPVHLGPRQRFADNRDRCRHHIDEGPFDLVQLRTEFLAEERRGREIERQSATASSRAAVTSRPLLLVPSPETSVALQPLQLNTPAMVSDENSPPRVRGEGNVSELSMNISG
jgi:hypothetical protein